MATGDRVDPFRGFNFRVEIASTSQAVAAFREVSGLNSTADPIEYRVGNSKDLHVQKLPGLLKYQNIMMKWGITLNEELWLWYKQIVNGIADRRNGAVVLLDEVGADVLRWNFYEAWPTKIEWPAMNATANEIAVNSFEICVEKLELV